jgi:hypothetical protein
MLCSQNNSSKLESLKSLRMDGITEMRYVGLDARFVEHQQLIVTENHERIPYIMQIFRSNQNCQRLGTFNRGPRLVRGRIGMMAAVKK